MMRDINPNGLSVTVSEGRASTVLVRPKFALVRTQPAILAALVSECQSHNLFPHGYLLVVCIW